MYESTLIVFAILATTSSASVSCPSGYSNYFGTNCYRFVTTRQSWEDSRALCIKDGGEMASIHSFEENSAIAANMPNKQASGSEAYYFWIGLLCDIDTEQFSWTDDTHVDYEHIYLNFGCTDGTGYALLTSPYQFQWYDEGLKDKLQVLCKIDTSTTQAPPDIAGTECGSGYDFFETTNSCVRISHEQLSWTDAEASCQSDGAHLISIHSRQNNDAIRTSSLSNRLTNGVFIGAQLGNNSNLSWSDGSDVDYRNFNPGMPNQLFGNCSLMDTRTMEAKWTSVACDNTNRFPFVCAKAKPCPADNTYTMQGDVYSPEYPNSLSSGLSCEYFVAVAASKHVHIAFAEVHLMVGDSVLLYDGLSADTPMAVITSTTTDNSFSTTNGNILRIIHQTGAGRGLRMWNAKFEGF